MNLNILGIERLTLFRAVYEQCSILSLISSTESKYSIASVFETVSEAMLDSVDQKLQNGACPFLTKIQFFEKIFSEMQCIYYCNILMQY